MRINKYVIACAVAVAMVTTAYAASKKAGPVTIQDGTLVYAEDHYLAGQPLTVGYDVFGYNYQAHMFRGSYANVYLGGEGFPPYEGDDAAYLAQYPAAENKWYWPYRADMVEMKWSDAWLANTDADGDNLLDRHFGFPSYIGSGAWETNHQSDEYTDGDEVYTWNYFVKIVAAPSDATEVAGVWYDSSGTEIGPVIWGEFATIQEIYNDTGTGDHGVMYASPAGPGLGKY